MEHKNAVPRNYHIIGACSCWGAQIRSCETGPNDLVQGQVFERLKALGISIREIELLYPKLRASDGEIPLSKVLPIIHDFNLKIFNTLRKAIHNGSFPIVIGGDHTNGVGTWNGVERPFGLLWIDAHMDAHTEKTTPSGAYHGMPVAALLGHGLPELAKLVTDKPVLKPQNLALIGVHSFEEGEADLLQALHVKIYFIDEVVKRGWKAIIPEAIEHVMRGVSHYGVSIDLDVFSIDEAPGVGSPEEGGISSKEFLPLLHLFGMDPRLIAFEIAEFNPDWDIGHRTRELVFKILKEVMR